MNTNDQPATPSADEEIATPRFEIERALDFAESGESTGGDTTHWSLKTLARAFRQLERELASLQSARDELRQRNESLKWEISDLKMEIQRLQMDLDEASRT